MTDLSTRIEGILKKRAEVEAQITDLYARKKELGEKLKEVQSQVGLICQDCGHTSILANEELIREYYNGWYSRIDEMSYSQERLLWVCPSCSYISYIRDDDDPKWGNPRDLSKVTYKWYSDPGSREPEDRVTAIMAPALERRAKERAKREKGDMLESARQVLREHGEL
jgi:hypothetical protein